MKIHKICLILFAFTPILFVNPISIFAENQKQFHEYIKPDTLSEEEWKNVQPYLLPFNHPLKRKLDRLFSSSRVTNDTSSLSKAGFENPNPARFSNAIVSLNKHIRGYYFKFYSDQQQIDVESKQWIDRAFEAKSLKKAIHDHGYEKYFKVPEKWIYLIPPSPPPTGPYPKHFVLVAKKINIKRGEENRFKWKTEVTPKLLNAIWILTQQEGLIDSLVPHNLPFTKHNKLVFVDLEQNHRWPIPFDKLTRYLNHEMQAYWTNLIDNGGPK